MKISKEEPLIFLHGFLGSSCDWEAVIARLPHRRCVALDLPGHGMTPWTEEELDLSACHLIGYSMGGRLALRFALQHPERIKSLTLLSTHYGLETDEQKRNRLAADRIWIQKLNSLPFDQFLQEWYAQPVFSSLQTKPDLLKQIIAMKKKSADLAKALEYWSLGHQPCYRSALLQFPKPIRILYGEQDHKFAALYAGWPQAIAIKEAGHCLHLETPEAVAAQL